MANLTQVAPGGVERPDVALKEDLDAVVQTANDAKTQAQETADFLETRVPIGRTINSLPLDQDIVITADDLNTYDKDTIDAKLAALEAGGYNPVHVNGHLLDRDVILSAGDVGTYSSSEIDGKINGFIPSSRKVNNKPLTADITLTAADLGVYSKTEVDNTVGNLVSKDTKINGYPLSQDITIQLTDLGGADDLVPRTFRINNKQLNGLSIDLTADDVGAISQSYVDGKLIDYMPLDNLQGLGNAPYPVTSDSFATKVTGSGFYEYAAGTVTDENGVEQPSSVSDRPTGSVAGRVIILSNAPVKDADGNVTTPSTQDLLAFPNDLDGLWFKKGGSNVWQQVGSGSSQPPMPNVWAQLNDSLVLALGNAPYDTITIGSDTIDLNSKSVTFARASTATYIDNAGVLQTADTDEARFEREGLLIEGQATNYIRYSNDPTQWKSTGATDSTLNQTNAADGTTRAMTAAFTVGTAKANINLISSSGTPVALAVGATMSMSCRVKIPSTLRVRIRFGNSAGYAGGMYFNSAGAQIGAADGVVGTATLDSDGFLTIKVTYTAAVADSSVYGQAIIYDISSVDNNIAVGTACSIQMPQVELGPVCSSFIISGSAATTRASDMVSLAGATNWKSSEFTVSAEIHTNWDAVTPNDAPRILDFTGMTNALTDSVALAAGWTSAKTVYALLGSGASAVPSYLAYTGRNKTIGMRLANGQLTAFASGVMNTPVAVSYTPGNTSTTMRIGGQTTSGTRHLFGHIRNLRIWHRALKDSEIKGLQ